MKPKPKTTPTLRFPGFAGGWGERRLGELCSTFRSGSGITSENISEAGKFPVFGGNGLRGYTDTFTHDGVFFLIGRQGALCGNINLVKGKTFISEHAIAVAGNELTDTAWLAFRLHHHNLNRLSESSAQPGLSVGKLTRLKFHIPTLPEQRKIAAFLTAVDGRLEQLRQKQALLADYKRGVMQQLFTQALRFKDDHGQDFPDWEERRLVELCSTFKSGKGITAEQIHESGEYPVYGGNGLRGYTDTFTHDGVFMLIGRQGALCGNINRVSGKSYISEHAIAIAGSELAATEWLAQRLDYMNLNRLSESSAQPGLAVNKLERLKLLAPSLPEQTKIAAFLSALDRKSESVAAQLDHTRAFKQGLLQQLFV